ncbi:MAG: hypothetical protein ACI9JN_000138 [Bacteroidia bacterium]|jgi:hypothetical protein
MESTKGCIIKHKRIKIYFLTIERIVIQVVTVPDLNLIQLVFDTEITNPKPNDGICRVDFLFQAKKQQKGKSIPEIQR